MTTSHCTASEREAARDGRQERGSLALEQVLFIGAVVAMSVGLYAFYNDLGGYFSNFSTASPPSNVGASGSSAT